MKKLVKQKSINKENLDKPPSMKNMEEIISQNTKKIFKKFYVTQTIIEYEINLEMKITAGIFPYLGQSNRFKGTYPYLAEKINFNTYTKFLQNFYSAFELTNNGQYGSARIILRNIFESLIISKYCSITDDREFIKKWERGEDLKLSNEIFNALEEDIRKPLKKFWKELCKFNHATTYSGQIDFLFLKEDEKQVDYNYAVLEILFNCMYFFVNKYWITREVRKQIYPLLKNKKIIKFDKKLEETIKVHRKYLNLNSRKVINAYKKNWGFNFE